MKTFKVPIKNTSEDFIVTNNLWLTLNCEGTDCVPFKKDNKNELLFGIAQSARNIPQIPDAGATNLAGQFDRLSESFGGINMFYLNPSENLLRFQTQPDIQTVLFRGKKGETVLLNKDGSSQNVEDGDTLVGFSGRLSANELEKLKDIVLRSGHISYRLIRDIREFFESYHSDITPVFVVDISDHQSYSFPIKSSLKTVSLTIDMIKNKLVKHDLEKVWQVETVVHEALVNAITYGNDMDNMKNIDISYEMGKKGLRLVIRDKGTGFDVNNITVPVGHEALEKVNGRGIYIMQKFSDGIFYNEKGNELILFFNF